MEAKGDYRMSTRHQQEKPLAFSYLRFSNPSQADGDTIRRQNEKRDAWLKRNDVRLDTSLAMTDRGVSAFRGAHRDNPDRHALAAFLKLVQAGRIPKGSYLIIENLDRLSREAIRPALTLLLNLIDAGIRVVQLAPVEQVFTEDVDPMQLMMAIMELSRGHSESVMKSDRIGMAWREKKKRARSGQPLTGRTPAWIQLTDAGLALVPAAAAIVQRIYRMAREGRGVLAITKQLNREKVPPIGGTKRTTLWQRSYVTKLLTSRKVIGEYQPYIGRWPNKQPDGPPIPNYFPAVITEEEWNATRAAIARRKHKGGRPGKQRTNLFAGLLHDARSRERLHIFGKVSVAGGRTSTLPILRAAGAHHRPERLPRVFFPLSTFESAILSCLREIDPSTILPQPAAANQTMQLATQLANLETRIDTIKTRLTTDPHFESLLDVLQDLDRQRQTILQELGEARLSQTSVLAEAWTGCQTLIGLLHQATDPEETRLRLRSAIRHIIQEIWCLFLVRGHSRLAAVQIWFVGGKRHRDYLIYHQNPTGNRHSSRPARWSVRSLVKDAAAGELDLRIPEHVKRLEHTLAALNLESVG